jgi:hyperosmotically inducible protein
MSTHGRGFLLSLIMVVSLALSASCGKTVAARVDDASVTTRVRTALLNDPEIKAQSISVDTVQGVVTLSGNVRTAQERDKAVAVARRASGVADVKSALQIAN